jgi:hypothetical protein
MRSVVEPGSEGFRRMILPKLERYDCQRNGAANLLICPSVHRLGAGGSKSPTVFSH